MITKVTLVICAVLFLQPCLANENFSLYLVRHAEKEANSKNPPLTQCGKARARQLAELLSTTQIKSIYSTRYQRTLSTAAPLSNKLNIAIKNYNPKQLAQFALQLKQTRKNTLIVGHSNTTPELVQLLSDQQVEPINEENYQNLYQLQFIAGSSQLTILKQPLICKRP